MKETIETRCSKQKNIVSKSPESSKKEILETIFKRTCHDLYRRFLMKNDNFKSQQLKYHRYSLFKKAIAFYE